MKDRIKYYQNSGEINEGQAKKLETANKYKTTIQRKAHDATIQQIDNAMAFATPLEARILTDELRKKARSQRERKSLTSEERTIVKRYISDF